MQRITKRDEQGNIDIDGLAYALDKLARYEDTGLEPHQIADYQMFYKRITDLHNCQDCACLYTCKHAPKWGDNIRINCFAWESTDKMEKEGG